MMLFHAVMKFLSRLVEFKMLVNWGLIHSIIKKINSRIGTLTCKLLQHFGKPYWLQFENILNSNYQNVAGIVP